MVNRYFVLLSISPISLLAILTSLNTPLIKIEEKGEREGKKPHCWLWVGVAKSHPHNAKKSYLPCALFPEKQ